MRSGQKAITGTKVKKWLLQGYRPHENLLNRDMTTPNDWVRFDANEAKKLREQGFIYTSFSEQGFNITLRALIQKTCR